MIWNESAQKNVFLIHESNLKSPISHQAICNNAVWSVNISQSIYIKKKKKSHTIMQSAMDL